MDEIELVDIYALPDREEAYRILYDLLAERTVDQSISHKGMPSFEQHRAFVDGKPYSAWYLIKSKDEGVVGAVYLSLAREVGMFVFRRFWSMGIGPRTIMTLKEKHPGRLLANINPANERSIQFFKKLGFTHIQNTYELV